MKDLNCTNCDTSNLVNDITEAFKCGECGEINPRIDVDTLYSDNVHLNKMHSDLADRLRVRDREVERLSKLLIDNNIETDYDMELCVQNEEIKILEEAVRFYANDSSWDNANELVDYVCIVDSDHSTIGVLYDNKEIYHDVHGGKRARQVLEKLKEIRKTK